jgi:ABC-type dipeptide/oligopeptide/nickel transport system ATPase component
MLTELTIRNFRLFRDITVRGLARVNLLVGKNNSGKSCLLEAVRIYVAKGSPAVLAQLVDDRDEYFEPELAQDGYETVGPTENPLRFLFHGYHLPSPGDEGISIGTPGDNSAVLRLTTGLFRLVDGENGVPSLLSVAAEDSENLGDLEMRFVADYSGEPQFRMLLTSSLRSYARRVAERYRKDSEPVQSVPPQSATNEMIPLLWDAVNLTDVEGEVVKCVQMMDPRVTGIAVIGVSKKRAIQRVQDRLPVVRVSDSNERIPLKSMGDGMLRLFHIVLALVNAKDGFLLIDEFENGVHWSVQPKLWETVFRLAKELNVQVFATTHSRDCVKAFAEVWQNDPETGGFQRLEADAEHGAISIPYTISDLIDSITTDVEVR